jgi:IS5 family transposase
MGSAIPDFSTVWRFREALTEAKVIKELFITFTATLEQKGVITKAGTIVDASFVEVPRQRNSREENKMIKNGEVPPEWKDQPHKLSQKDLEARWAKKNQETFFGYKNHIRSDADSQIVTDYTVTDAAVHDSQPLSDLIGPQNKGENLFGDSAYKSAKIDAFLAVFGIKNYLHEKGARNRPLNALHKELNSLKSKVRACIEHIFGCVENSMGGPELEYIGQDRIATGIGLSNLAYNLLRYVQLIMLGRVPAQAQCV